MHIISTRNPVVMTKARTLEPGDYLVEALSGAQLMCHADGDSMTPLTEAKPFDETLDWNGKSILVTRVGGIGDLILLTPILREIHRRWPTVRIDVVSNPEFGQVLKNLPYIHELLPYPSLKKDADAYDCWIFLENVIERDAGLELHSVDAVAKHIGLTGDFDKVQDYRVTDNERIWAAEAHPRSPGVRRICVQASASARNRTYPHKPLQEMIEKLLKEGWEVFMVGKPGEIKMDPSANMPPTFRVLTDGLTFRHRAAVIETADVVLAPDSSILHVAGALNVPAVGLFGVFPAKLRVAYNPLTVGINGTGACAPCFHQNRMGKEFPDKCPSMRRGVCQVLESISTKTILAKIKSIAKGPKLELLSGGADGAPVIGEKPLDTPPPAQVGEDDEAPAAAAPEQV